MIAASIRLRRSGTTAAKGEGGQRGCAAAGAGAAVAAAAAAAVAVAAAAHLDVHLQQPCVRAEGWF